MKVAMRIIVKENKDLIKPIPPISADGHHIKVLMSALISPNLLAISMPLCHYNL